MLVGIINRGLESESEATMLMVIEIMIPFNVSIIFAFLSAMAFKRMWFVELSL